MDSFHSELTMSYTGAWADRGHPIVNQYLVFGGSNLFLPTLDDDDSEADNNDDNDDEANVTL